MKPSPRIPLLILAFGALVMTPMGASAQDLEPPPPPPDADVDMNAPPPQAAEPPPQAPDQQAFEQQLAPYGRWVVTPEYGRVWVPANVGPEWQPYADGQWVSSSWGWSFSAPVPWGWAVYHYGRWAWGPALGWYWVPGYVWGTAAGAGVRPQPQFRASHVRAGLTTGSSPMALLRHPADEHGSAPCGALDDEVQVVAPDGAVQDAHAQALPGGAEGILDGALAA